MTIAITLLIMQDDKTHSTLNPEMRHSAFSVVDVFPYGKLQRQASVFYTVDIPDAPYDTLDEVKAVILRPLYGPQPDPEVTPKILARRRYALNASKVPADKRDEIRASRHVAVPWNQAKKYFDDLSVNYEEWS